MSEINHKDYGRWAIPDWNDLILGSEVESDVVALGENPGGLG